MASETDTEDERALTKRRFLVLMDTLEATMTKQEAADFVGVDASYANKVRTEERRSIGFEIRDRIVAKLSLDRRFFTDASLGERPDYKLFIGRKEETLEKDEIAETVEDFVRRHPGSEVLLRIQWRSFPVRIDDDFLAAQLLIVRGSSPIATPPAPREGRMKRAKK